MRAILVLLCFRIAFAANYPCDVEFSIDISDGARSENDVITKDGVSYSKENYFEYEGKVMGCVCNIKACIRKCCPTGQYIADSSQTCTDTNADFSVDAITAADITTYSIITGKCNTPSILLDPENSTEDSFSITTNGSLLWTDMEVIELSMYCVDYVRNTDTVKALVCVDDTSTAVHNTIGISTMIHTGISFTVHL